MDDVISREEHEEFRRRMEEAHHRQDKRLSMLEESVREMGALTAAVEKLATNMEHMAKEQELQGQRLSALEGRDGVMWRKALGYIGSAVAGGIVVFLLKTIGIV